MQAVTGIFLSQTEAEQAVRKLQSSGLQADRVTLLTPGGKGPKKLESVPIEAVLKFKQSRFMTQATSYP